MLIDEATRRICRRLLESTKKYAEKMTDEDRKLYREMVDPPYELKNDEEKSTKNG